MKQKPTKKTRAKSPKKKVTVKSEASASPTKKVKAEILKVHDTYWNCYLKGDVKAMATLLADGYTQVGSAEAEVFFTKKDAIKFLRDTIKEVAGKVDMRKRLTKLEAHGDMILVHELCDLYGKADKQWVFYSKFRASTWFKESNNSWKIIHQHSSFPDARTDEGENLAIEKIEAENQQLKEAVKRRTVELESKNRELEIETALERVRARTMAMQHSNELSDVVYVLYKQMQQLGFDYGACTITLMNTATGDTDWWMAGFSELEYPDCYHVNYFDHPGYKAVLDAWKRKEKFASIEIKGASKRAYDKIMFSETGFSKLPEHVKAMMAGFKSVIYSMAYMRYGALSFGPTSITDAQKHMLQKFSDVFEQTYTRFLDLQKAEAQAREAQIEAALERVRSTSLAMHTSQDLSKVVYVVFTELIKLDAQLDRCLILTVNPETLGITWYLTGKEGLLSNNGFLVENNSHPSHQAYLEGWKTKRKKWHYLLAGKEKKSCDAYLFSQTQLAQLPDFIKADMSAVESIQLTISSDDFGCLIASSISPLSDAHATIVDRFTSVFNQTYTRFLDLQKAEAQAKEAQIEAAMEKVRSRSLAMQKPEELTEVAELLRKEMGQLGVEELETSSIYIVDKENEQAECWYAIKDIREENKRLASDEMTITFADSWVGSEMWKFYRSKMEQASIVMKGDNRKEWINYCAGKSQVLQGYYGDEIPERTYHLVKFNGGYMGAASPGDISAESWDLLRRAASVFSLAYTRFNDLQIAEAHAQQAEEDLIAIKEAKQKAEEALTELQATQKQLIQSEKMASLGELTAGIAHEIQNPLNFVNNFSEVSTELVTELKVERSKVESERDKDLEEELLTDIFKNLEKINHHGKRAGDIVKGMLQHSRSSSGLKEPTDINALADEYLRLAYHGLRAKDKTFNATMKTDFDSSIGNINVVPQDIGRVILNLITNAFYVVNEKAKTGIENYEPTVTVSTHRSLSSGEGRGEVLIKVKDNGSGIPDAIKEKIFQPFFTTKPTGQGTGLGLSLSYDIVKAHDGELKVKTKDGQGSEFIIHLPIV